MKPRSMKRTRAERAARIVAQQDRLIRRASRLPVRLVAKVGMDRRKLAGIAALAIYLQPQFKAAAEAATDAVLFGGSVAVTPEGWPYHVPIDNIFRTPPAEPAKEREP